MPTRPHRINPFAFPPETNTRFTLLVVTAFGVLISSAAYVMLFLFDDVASEGLRNFLIILGVGVVVALVSILSAARYSGHADRIRRRRALRPLPPGQYVRFQAEAGRLAGLAGVHPTPSLEVSEGSKLADGQAFGRQGAYALRVGGRLPLLLSTDPEAARATLLHELGHIANEDVGRTYYTQSLWEMVVLAGFLPLTLVASLYFLGNLILNRLLPWLLGRSVDWSTFFSASLPTFLALLGQILIVVVFITLVRASVLRVREVYADWRAALWGAEPGLIAILKRELDQSPRWSFPARLFRLHPHPGERLRALAEPERLFRLTLDIPVIAGLLIAAVLTPTFYLGLNLITSTEALGGAVFGQDSTASLLFIVPSFFLTLYLPLIAVMWLVAGTVGLQAQRDAVMKLATGQPVGLGHYLRLIPPALLFVAAIQLGFNVIPGGGFIGSIPAVLGDLPLSRLLGITGGTILWLILMGISAFAWLCAADLLGRRLYGVHTGPKPPRRRRHVLDALLAFNFSVVMVAALVGQSAIYNDLSVPGLREGEFLFWLAAGGALSSAFASALIWAVVELWRATQKRECPECRQPAVQKVVIGQQCSRCGAELAPWLYVEE